MRTSTRFVPRLDPLEMRCVPACRITDNLGILTVLGDNARNVIQITDNGQSAPGSVTVTCGTVTHTSTDPVRSIRVQGRGGNDRVTYDLTADFAPKVNR